MKPAKPLRRLLGFTMLLLLSACATAPEPTRIPAAEPPPQAAPAAMPSQPSAEEVSAQRAQQDLDDGVALFDKGDFDGAIRRLQNSPDIWQAAEPVRVQAYKTIAFGYCVTRRRAACRQNFERLLKLDPAFRLAPAEAGHPMWGPVFRQAQREQQRQARTHRASPRDVAHGAPSQAATQASTDPVH